MAALVYIDIGNERGQIVTSALKQISAGIATLRQLDGLRAECIAVGAETVETVFGVSAGGGQAFSDTWNGFVGTEYGGAGCVNLRALLDDVVAG